MPLPAVPAIPAEPDAPELPPDVIAPALPPAPELDVPPAPELDVPPAPALDVPPVPAELLLVPAAPAPPDCPPVLDAEPAEPGLEPGSFPDEQATTESNATETRDNVLFMVSDWETYRDQWKADRQRKSGSTGGRWVFLLSSIAHVPRIKEFVP